MASIEFEGKRFASFDAETVLDTLLRGGAAIPNACRAGACQACLLRASTGSVPAEARLGLHPALAGQGYFLSCQWKPQEDIVIASAGALDREASILTLQKLSPTVLRVRLRVESEFSFRAGQYLTLIRHDGLARPYSIASLPESGMLELHVRRIPEGRLSGWLFDEASEGGRVRVRGPAGNCFYLPGNPDQPLLLAGTGTGLAPLYGIVQDALRQGHRGGIVLYHGALNDEGLYMREELQALAAAEGSFRYEPVVLEGSAARTGRLEQVIAADHPKLAGWRAFLCGDPAIVAALKKKVFLSGMPLREIYSDPFLPAPCN
ncbi:MAG: 2Fe-2S iron-sulfur cluster binding domain-containing protein [Acidobacteria bacterium]|nr:2Fe-2S iron-sulfur cluster binding domain-containing protein [Acidobacteriota bacterium]